MLRKDKVTILDGGMGRLLEQMGAPFKQPEWSALSLMEAPEYVTKAHEAFIESGAEIITTNTYALVPFHIGKEKFEQEGQQLIELAAKLAKETAKDQIKVAGSLPPAFGSYRPDLFNPEQAEKIYLPLIEEQDNFVDLWIAETMSSTIEIEVLGNLLKNNSKPFWVAFNILDRETTDTPPQLRSGETIQEAIEVALKYGAKAILFNCCQVEEIEPALEIVKEINPPIPYGAYANAFPSIKEGELANDSITELRADMTPETYLSAARKWQTQGASIIGGCCGIEPDHIKALQNLNKSAQNS